MYEVNQKVKLKEKCYINALYIFQNNLQYKNIIRIDLSYENSGFITKLVNFKNNYKLEKLRKLYNAKIYISLC